MPAALPCYAFRLEHPWAETVRRATCNRTVHLGRRKHRRRKNCFLPLALALFSAACSQDANKLYQSAKDLYRVGRYTDANRQAQKGYALFKNEPRSVWRWKFALLAAEIELLNGATERADALLSDAPPEQFSALTPRYEMLRGYALYRHHSTESEKFLQRAIADSAALQDRETETDAWLNLGTVRAGDLSVADSAFQHAEELAQTNGLKYQQAAALVSRGFIQIKREHFADAIPLLEAALQRATEVGAAGLSTSASYNLANCYESLGNLDQALAVLETTVAQQKQFGLATLLSVGYSELGVIHFRKGETSEAIRYFQLAFDSVGKDASFQRSNAAGNLAYALLQIGSPEKAQHFNQLAFDYASRNDKLKIAFLTSNEAAIAERLGQHDRAIVSFEKALSIGREFPSVVWQAHAGLGAVYAARGDFANANANYTQALAVIASSRADQLKADYKITFLASDLIRFYQEYVDLLLQQGETNHALEIADSSRASVLAEDLLGQASVNRTGLLTQIQHAAKSSHSIFLFYWLAPKTSYVWAINGTQSEAVPLVSERQIAQDVASYRSLIEEAKRDPLAPTPSHAGTQLFNELLSPVAAFLPADARVVIVPDGVLHNLNFETLIVSTPQPHYWIEDATISVAPSLSIVQAGKSAPQSHRSLLLMGDPVAQGTGYPPLPEAALETANIQRQFRAADSTVLTGPKAFVDAYAAAQPEKFSTIHFATHVDANAQSPLDSAIILSPVENRFSLYARDVARIPLNADLVTISACRGAGARTLSGEGLVGFAWAFFQARAKNVVTSLWDVYDNSTAQLMNDFYASVLSGDSYARALRIAKLKMLHSNYKRPYYWAPFQLYSRTL